MFDTDEETFLERIPYPEALSRATINQGETWKLVANVEFVNSEVCSQQQQVDDAVQAAHDEHEDDYKNGEAEGRADAILEVYTSINRFIKNESTFEDLAYEIDLFFEELK